jgi:hypothetical protein
MHEYSIDIDRSRVYYWLVFLSIILSTVISKLLSSIIKLIPHIGLELTVSIAAFSVFGFFYKLFDKLLWKFNWIQKLGIEQTPNLSGIWKGTLRSSYHNWEKELPAVLEIEQTWNKICIIGKFNDSSSFSYTTSIKVNNGGGVKILYSYKNDIKTEWADSPFSDHKGYASLSLSRDGNTLQGEYFNNPSNNRNHGNLLLYKVSN